MTSDDWKLLARVFARTANFTDERNRKIYDYLVEQSQA